MDAQGYLVNVTTPALAPSAVFTVSDRAVRLTAKGFSGSEFIQIQVWVGDATHGAFADLARNGALVKMLALNNQHTEILAGKYKANYTGSTAGLVCYYDTDDLTLDKNAYYTMQVGAGV